MSRAHAASGARDRLVTIQALTEGKGDSNFPVDTWEDLAEVWAHKEDASARERFSFTANQETAPYDTRWTIPFMDAMDPELVNVRKARRLIVKGRVHDIVGATEIGRREGLELQTLAGGPAEAA
jgi:SPP1 family predicted phage head-tail adaptor